MKTNVAETIAKLRKIVADANENNTDVSALYNTLNGFNLHTYGQLDSRIFDFDIDKLTATIVYENGAFRLVSDAELWAETETSATKIKLEDYA